MVDELLKNWQQRNITGFSLKNRDQLHEKLLELIRPNATVGFSGSVTLEQLEVIELLESRGNKVFNQYNPELSSEESVAMRLKGANADYFLCSANAIAKTGELVFLSAYGHRIAGIASARNVIVIAGTNKITEGVYTALKRAREYATPLNCKRLNWDTPCLKDGICRTDICLYPEFRRMCCQQLVIEAEVNPERLKVLLVEEELGF
ncbi:MAG: lactate utilization protein [Deltaproteobacteria bacterium]